MVFSIGLYTALILCGIGLTYKVLFWFRYPENIQAQPGSTAKRIFTAFKGILSSLFSFKIFSLIKVFILDVLFLSKLRKESFVRWVMHFCIAYGFIFLLLMHALDRYVSQKLFSEYFSTLNPFLFLRNLFGVMMLVGVAIAVYRRIFNRVMRLTTNRMDIYALVVLSLIALSGFFLEATKIVSHERYEEMVSEFSSISDEEEAKALKSYWAKEFAVVFPQTVSKDTAVLTKGKEVHILNCVSCHSRPTAAFVSYGLAKAITPSALVLSQKSVREFFRYFHFLVCFLGLALLPFTKFFHVLTSPLVLLVNGVMDRTKAAPANIATIRAIELDACTHCATCSQHCSVEPVYREIPNINILPSEKLAAVTSLPRMNGRLPAFLPVLQEGASICTNCYRCTDVCPVGIKLQDQWFQLEKDLTGRKCPQPFIRLRDDFTSKFDEDRKKTIIQLTPLGKNFSQRVGLTNQGSTFNNCFTCLTCSNACPVVTNYQYPNETLGLLPHQIMHSLKFGIQDNVLGAGMVWDCLGCYNCQQNCPQGVRVTDIFFELKNMAFQKARSERT